MVLWAATAWGQPYPVKPVRIITSDVGGGADVLARTIARGISDPLGQQVIVENRGGGVIPGETVAKAPGDGYTLLLNGSTLWFLPLLREHQETAKVLNQADVKDRYLSAGVEVIAGSPEQLAAVIKTDVARWGKVIRDAGIRDE